MEGQYSQSYDERNNGRERRDEQSYASHSHSQSYPSHLNSQQSPSQNTSPFAFAPPPLSAQQGASRPTLSVHHSDPTGTSSYNPADYYKQGAQGSNSSLPYSAQPASSAMGYRSHSNESARDSPSVANVMLNRSGSYQSQLSNNGHYPGQVTSSPQRTAMYPPFYTPAYSQPTAGDMNRSLSYPSAAYSSQPYPYIGALSTPSLLPHQSGLPALNRHNTTAGMEVGMAGMDIRPALGYSFANRLPLVDRPFKCDECVQSFNRNHDLKRHKRIHLSVKPFGCDKCGKTFSRKDALRRHWLVKGCRGEEGATAPITPLFPLNTQPPALSPPTPPEGGSPGEDETEFPAPSSFSHPSCPPPLNLLSSRAPSDQSQILVTPSDVSQTGVGALEQSMLATARSSGSADADSGSGYFDGVVGLKTDGTAVIDKAQANQSPYNRYTNSPTTAMQGASHPYRRPQSGVAGVSPMQSARVTELSGADKPQFVMPFAPQANYMQRDGSGNGGMLAPPMPGEDVQMEKQGSMDGAPQNWNRWHRPSFPFPVPAGANYNNFDPSSPADGQAYAQA